MQRTNLCRTLALATAILLFVPAATFGHVYNFENKHETCAVYGPPQGHAVGDGHAHTHDPVAAAPLHDHDPCKQNRMAYPNYENNAPLVGASPPVQPIPPEQILFNDGDNTNTEAFVGGEYYQFPLAPSAWKNSNGFAVSSDLVAAGMGFPGTGTKTDPYIVEGYVVKGNMLFKDTSKCFVIRNNIVVNRVILNQVIPDPLNIINLPELTPYWQQVKATAQGVQAQYLDTSETWEGQYDSWMAQKATWDAQKASWDAQMDSYEQQAAAWAQQFADYEEAYYDHIVLVEQVANAFDQDSDTWGASPQPAKPYTDLVNYQTHDILDMAGITPIFEGYQEDLEGDLMDDDVEGWILANWPPEDAPPGFWGSEEDWDYERDNYVAAYEDALGYVADYWAQVVPAAPDAEEYAAFLAQQSGFQSQYDVFMDQYNAFMTEYDAFVVTYDEFQEEFEQVWASASAQIAAADTHFAKAAQWDFEYVGQFGTTLFDTNDQLLEWALQKGYGIVDALVETIDGLIPNPNLVVQNTGQLILDWNGQCVHAYNNVVHDLRVNQNNPRTGFATGGIIEDNRFFTIGQIRHYDGIFRENEVGNKAHLVNLLYPTVPVSSATPAQAVNNDGANQGWYYDNVIYGNVDLDFHGHHHSAGFFAPTSHYHGNTLTQTHMQTTTGTCTATMANVNQALMNGPEKDYPTDNDIKVKGTPIVTKTPPPSCLLHQDHGKRWTSVFFNDNIVIDPNGNGIRFEDRNHRADDEQANSENLLSLKRPHFHQKWVQLEDNVVVGKMFIDVLNAAGTDLWSDNWAALSPAAQAGGAARTAEAAQHPGARIVTSHPYRNDAWLDVQRNNVYATLPVAIQLADGDDMSLYRLKENQGFGFPKNFNAGMTPNEFVAWLKASDARTSSDTWSEIQGWNGQDRGVQTFATMAFLRDHFKVEHCGQELRGLDNSIVATDRIYDDGDSIIQACGSSDWGGAQIPTIVYTPAPTTPMKCTEVQRAQMDDTDDMYVSALVFDAVDPIAPATVCTVLQGLG